MTFALPEQLRTSSGADRRLGVELEFAGLPLEQISALVAKLFGGRVNRHSAFVHVVEGARWGDFQVEIDAALLKDRAYQPYLEAVGIRLNEADHRDRLEDMLARVAGTVVPHEIVTPPIPMTQAHELEHLREALRQQQARGTGKSVVYAFGLHLNPELAETSVATVLAHLRAFLLLWDWLFVRGEIDWSRRVTPFIREFPEAYRELVLDRGYAPEDRRFLADYLHHNPTRNRALDLLPVLRELFGDDAVRGLEDAALVKSRPAFHYRLPNCRIDEKDWRINHEWQGWVMVEWLAARPDTMAAMTEAWFDRDAPVVGRLDRGWAEESRRWLP